MTRLKSFFRGGNKRGARVAQDEVIYIWAFTFILLLLATISILALNDDTLYIDERISVGHLGDMLQQNTLIETAESIAEGSEQHSPGYFWLLNIWARLTGYTQTAMRYLSVLFGFISLAVIYRMGRNWYGPRAGLMAFSLLGASALSLYYFHELRMYSLITLLMLLLIWQYKRVVDAAYTPTRWNWLALYGIVLSLLYTHYFVIFPLVGVGLYHLAFVRKDRRWVQVSAAFVLAGLSFLPWIGVVIAGTTEVIEETRTGLPTLNLLWVTAWLFANGWVVLIGASLVGFGLAVRDRQVRLPLIVGLMVLLGLVVANLALGILPIRRARYLVMVLPFAALVVGYGLAKLPRQRLVLPALIALWLISGVQLHQDPSFAEYTNRGRFRQSDYPPYPEAISAMNRMGLASTPDDLLLANTNTPEDFIGMQVFISDYYLRWLNMDGRILVFPNTSITQEMLDLGALVTYLAYDPTKTTAQDQRVAQEMIRVDYTECGVLEDSQHLYLGVFVRQPAGCSLLEQPNLELDYLEQPLRLARYDLNQVDEQLAIVTTWAMLGEMPLTAYSYSLRVVDETGEYIVIYDNGLPLRTSAYDTADGTLGRDLAVLNTSDWVAGQYELRLVVYDWQTLERLNAADGSGSEITLGTFTYPLATQAIARR